MTIRFLPNTCTSLASQALCELIAKADVGSRVQLAWQRSRLNDATLVFMLDAPNQTASVIDLANDLNLCRRSREGEIAEVINALTDRFGGGGDIEVSFVMDILPDLRGVPLEQSVHALRSLRYSRHFWPSGHNTYVEADRLSITVEFLGLVLPSSRLDFAQWQAGYRDTDFQWGVYRQVQKVCPQYS